MTSNNRRRLGSAGLIVLTAIASSLVTTAAEAADNPTAQDAIGYLQAALADLQSLSSVPAGGHYSAARELIRKALVQVNTGMAF